METYTRDTSGKFIVALPFKDESIYSFPGSRSLALICFYNIERRLLKEPGLYFQYWDFVREYLISDHMEIVLDNKVPSDPCYYIHHHFREA